MVLFDLNNRVAVVTGASSGLGRDAAIGYAKAGADVALLARRVDKLEEVKKEIEKLGRKAISVKCDVSDEESVKNAVDTVIKKFGKIDILLNNAGVVKYGELDKLPTEDWDMVMNVNVKGIYLMSKYVVPHMKEKQYGRIVNITSINAKIATKNPQTARPVYNASKGAVIGLTVGMAASYLQAGITVNAIGPALFITEMTENSLNEKSLAMYNMLSPANRGGKSGELNGAIIYFSSEACSHTTGQTLFVDGGFSIV